MDAQPDHAEEGVRLVRGPGAESAGGIPAAAAVQQREMRVQGAPAVPGKVSRRAVSVRLIPCDAFEVLSEGPLLPVIAERDVERGGHVIGGGQRTPLVGGQRVHRCT